MKSFSRFVSEASEMTDFDYGLYISNPQYDGTGKLTTFDMSSATNKDTNDFKVIKNSEWDKVAKDVVKVLGFKTIEKDFKMDNSNKIVFQTEVMQNAMSREYVISVNGRKIKLPKF